MALLPKSAGDRLFSETVVSGIRRVSGCKGDKGLKGNTERDQGTCICIIKRYRVPIIRCSLVRAVY